MKTSIMAVLAALVWFGAAVEATENDPKTFLDAVSAYHQSHYQEAAAGFTALAESGIENGALYYNLGNANLRAGDLGRAVLYYERALRLLPRDPDLRFNLAYARSLTRDQTEEEDSAWHQVLLFWDQLLSMKVLQWWAVLSNGLFWALAGLTRYRPSSAWKAPAILLLAMALFFSAAAFGRFYTHHNQPKGVVLAAQVAVRSGLSNEATELFSLHAGTVVRVERALDQHYRITFAPGKFGWVDQAAIGII